MVDWGRGWWWWWWWWIVSSDSWSGVSCREKYFEVPRNILKYLNMPWNILEYFAERRQSDELQRREKEQRGRGVVQSVATRYVTCCQWYPWSSKTRSFCVILWFLCCSLIQVNHNYLQTFGEDSEMLAEDLYYHRVVIIYAHFRNILVEDQVTNSLDLDVLLDACWLLTCSGLFKMPLK